MLTAQIAVILYVVAVCMALFFNYAAGEVSADKE